MGLEQSITEAGVEPGELTVPEMGKPSAELEPDLEEEGPDAEKSTEPIVPAGPAKQRAALHRENEALLIKTTCRSGEVIRYPGDVVILADVNPGAEIIADGDILVFGSLRGLAHAGAGGDIQATIIALNLDASRIQIGPYIGMAPRSRKKSKSNRAGPSLVFVRRQHIYVAPFKGRFAGYSEGTLYDG